MIAKILRAQSEQVSLEPLPERWVDLIHHLNAQERRSQRRQPEAQPRERPQRVELKLCLQSECTHVENVEG